jgi:hypothetical protein
MSEGFIIQLMIGFCIGGVIIFFLEEILPRWSNKRDIKKWEKEREAHPELYPNLPTVASCMPMKEVMSDIL